MIGEKLREQLGDWECLYPFFESEQWKKLREKIKPDFNKTTPQMENWFRAFRECPWDEVKVVWVGLSPYYTVDPNTKQNVADGLAFSTSEKHLVPPSLFKLYKGIEWDLWNGYNRDMMRSNDLTYLAKQGILLLNSALTTVYGNSEAHIDIWRPFLEFVMTKIITNKTDLVITGFGKVAHNLTIMGNKNQHVLNVEHPAASAYQGRDWSHLSLIHI